MQSLFGSSRPLIVMVWCVVLSDYCSYEYKHPVAVLVSGSARAVLCMVLWAGEVTVATGG